MKLRLKTVSPLRRGDAEKNKEVQLNTNVAVAHTTFKCVLKTLRLSVSAVNSVFLKTPRLRVKFLYPIQPLFLLLHQFQRAFDRKLFETHLIARLGATSTDAKVCETAAALRAGAQEIDMVINVGALRSGDTDAVKNDIQSVVRAAHQAGAIVKVILETALLDDTQKTVASQISKSAGADFVKTSTGFSTSGATVHDIALMRAAVGPNIGVKASGGIRTLQDVQAMTAAGATRIGASASVKIVEATAA